MKWAFINKLLLFFVVITFLLLASFSYLKNTFSNKDSSFSYDLTIQSQAEEVRGLYFPNIQNEGETELSSHLSVPQAVKWYQDNYPGTGWTMDLPSEDPSNEQIQQIKLAKPGFRMTISFISDGNGGTRIIIEQHINQDSAS